MIGILCNRAEFKELNEVVQVGLTAHPDAYYAIRWADIKVCAFDVEEGKYFFPLEDSRRGEIISKILNGLTEFEFADIEFDDFGTFKGSTIVRSKKGYLSKVLIISYNYIMKLIGLK